MGAQTVQRLENPFYPFAEPVSYADSRLYVLELMKAQNAWLEHGHSCSFVLFRWAVGIWEGVGLDLYRD